MKNSSPVVMTQLTKHLRENVLPQILKAVKQSLHKQGTENNTPP